MEESSLGQTQSCIDGSGGFGGGDAYSNDGIGGLGNVVSAQPSIIPGKLNDYF